MEERWRAIPGYGGRYYVSDRGRVKTTTCIGEEALMHPTDNGNGYKIVGLREKGKKRKNHYLHRLVAEAFLEAEDGKNYVDHIDHNKANNDATNLRWCTQKENISFSLDNMRGRMHRSETNTGERYISKDKKGRFRVHFRGKEYGRFRILAAAIAARDAVLTEKGVIL